MRFTLRRNGRHKATVTTSHYVGSAELAQILARYCMSGYGMNAPDLSGPFRGDDLARGKLAKNVRDLVFGYGAGAYVPDIDWTEELADHEAARIAYWAARQVRRLYPQLDDPALAEWLADYTKHFPDEDELYDEEEDQDE